MIDRLERAQEKHLLDADELAALKASQVQESVDAVATLVDQVQEMLVVQQKQLKRDRKE